MSTILVGNSSSVSGRSCGATIDTFDEVVRYSRFQTRGFEKDVGSKTTLWCVSKIWMDRGIQSKMAEKRMEYPDLKDCLCVSYKGKTDGHDLYDDFIRNHGLDKCIPSTGLMSMFYFLHVYKHMLVMPYFYIVNFDFGNSNHYFGHKNWSALRVDAPKNIYPNKNHNWQQEKLIVDMMIKKGWIKEL